MLDNLPKFECSLVIFCGIKVKIKTNFENLTRYLRIPKFWEFYFEWWNFWQIFDQFYNFLVSFDQSKLWFYFENNGFWAYWRIFCHCNTQMEKLPSIKPDFIKFKISSKATLSKPSSNSCQNPNLQKLPSKN